MREVNNEVRAGAAEAAIWAFAKDIGEWHDDMDADFRKEMLEQNISDFIADLLHLCDAEEIDFNQCLHRGGDHHAEEVWEEQQDKLIEQDDAKL